jgi:hypothetical protein
MRNGILGSGLMGGKLGTIFVRAGALDSKCASARPADWPWRPHRQRSV